LPPVAESSVSPTLPSPEPSLVLRDRVYDLQPECG
jgi:hypothetical protein